MQRLRNACNRSEIALKFLKREFVSHFKNMVDSKPYALSILEVKRAIICRGPWRYATGANTAPIHKISCKLCPKHWQNEVSSNDCFRHRPSGVGISLFTVAVMIGDLFSEIGSSRNRSLRAPLRKHCDLVGSCVQTAVLVNCVINYSKQRLSGIHN